MKVDTTQPTPSTEGIARWLLVALTVLARSHPTISLADRRETCWQLSAALWIEAGNEDDWPPSGATTELRLRGVELAGVLLPRLRAAFPSSSVDELRRGAGVADVRLEEAGHEPDSQPR